MMKIKFIYFLILGIGLSSLSSFACDSLCVAKNKHGIAINLSYPIIKLISKSNTDSAATIKAPILYLFSNRKKMHYRLGLYTQWKDRSEKNKQFDGKTTITNLSTQLIFGAYKPLHNQNKWDISAGLNVLVKYKLDRSNFETSFDIVKLYECNAGLGLAPGIQINYHLSNRISLMTEYMVTYLYTYTETGNKFTAFPNENRKKQTNHTQEINVDFPISFYLFYHF